MGFVSEISWPEMKCQMIIGELNYAPIFQVFHTTQIEASVTLFAFVVLISQFLENDM